MSEDAIRFYKSSSEHGYLSNLFLIPVHFEGREFRSSEDAYQYGKFRDKHVAEAAMGLPAPRFVAILAHGLFIYDISEGWSDNKVPRMKAIVKAKFEQHPDLMEKLIATGDAVLIEASKTDRFWGEGPNGKGKNMLGQILMEVRIEEQNGQVNHDPKV